MADTPASSTTSPRGTSLRTKALALFGFLVLCPALVVAALLVEVNREAVELSERNLQAAVLSSTADHTLSIVRNGQDDARAIAAALAVAVENPDQEPAALAAVRSLLATRRSITAARFEVPTADVSTVLRKDDAGDADPPASTADLRTAADRDGIGFALSPEGGALLTVPVLTDAKSAARGYVTVPIDLEPLRAALAEAAETRFGESAGTRLVVVDEARHVVVSQGLDARRGDDLSAHPVWSPLPDGVPRTGRLVMVAPHDESGTPMVGTVSSVEDLGWAVAVWRPESVAYEAVSRMRTRSLWVAGIATLLALLLGHFAARTVTRPVIRMGQQAQLIGQRRWDKLQLRTDRKDELGDLVRSISGMADDLQSSEKEVKRQVKVRTELGRFMPKEVVDGIVRGDHDLELGGQRADVTVLFADMVAFTPLAEERSAEEVVTLLNELFSVLTEVVFRHGGTVDKFIGDCIMAVWGAPVPQEDHAERALAAAADMMRFLETANEDWKERFGVEVQLGIGINSGQAVVGNFGSEKRMEYTVVGDVVNVAARLESIAGPNQVLVGGSLHDILEDEEPDSSPSPKRKLRTTASRLTLVGERNLTGRRASTRVYRLETET